MTDPTPQPSPSPGPLRPADRKDPLTFDRLDRWGLGIILGLVAAATVVAQVVQPVLRWVGGDALPVEVITPVEAPGLDLRLGDGGAGTVEVLLPELGAPWRLLDLLPGVLMAAMVVLGCWLLVSVMRTVAAGDPFHPSNVRRMRAVGGLLVLGAPVVHFFDRAVTDALLAQYDLGGVEVVALLTVPGLPVLAGMVVALLAEAFKGGSRLRDDVEGLV